MNIKATLFDQGLATAPEKSTLHPGELTVAKGCEYRLGSSEIHKQPGRSVATTTGLATEVLALRHLRYNSGSDKFAAMGNDGVVYTSTPGTSLTFASEKSGFTTGLIPQFASLADRWVMFNGTDDNNIREPNNVPGSATPWRTLGMIRALGKTTVTVNPRGATASDTAIDRDWET